MFSNLLCTTTTCLYIKLIFGLEMTMTLYFSYNETWYTDMMIKMKRCSYIVKKKAKDVLELNVSLPVRPKIKKLILLRLKFEAINVLNKGIQVLSYREHMFIVLNNF